MGLSALRIIEGVIITVIGGLILLLTGYAIQNPTIVNNLTHYSISSNLLWIGIIIFTVILVILLMIHFRKNRGGSVSGISENRAQSYVQYVYLSTMSYDDVLWEILQPMRNNIQSSEIIVKSKPRCPECKTELIEEKTWCGYVWKCVRNDFKTTKKHNFSHSAELLVRDARRSYEEGKFS